MTSIIKSFDVESPQHKKSFQLDLVDGLDEAHIAFIEKSWAPILRRQRDLAILEFFQLPESSRTDEEFQRLLGKFGAPDEHWKWRAKCTVVAGSNQKILGLVNGSDVEAAMLLHLGKLSRDPTPQPIVYIDYVAVAPFNRREIQIPQRFKHLGTVLLGAAVETSVAMGRDGRCGLHSLPQSEGFYRHLGMTDRGIDLAYDSLRYFEFDAQVAKKLAE